MTVRLSANFQRFLVSGESPVTSHQSPVTSHQSPASEGNRELGTPEQGIGAINSEEGVNDSLLTHETFKTTACASS